MDQTIIIQKQREFYRAGNTRPYAYRMRMLTRLQRAVDKYEEEIKAALYADLKKSGYESYLTEISQVKSELSFVKKHLRSWMRVRRTAPSMAQLPGTGAVLPQPYGVVLIMAPWNYPFLLNMDPLIDAIGAGNCCVLKPSAYAPSVSRVIAEMIASVFPPEYVTVIEGGREENAMLLEQPFDKIFFTGSPAMGKVVMEKASARLTPVTLELGGKSPCIVEKSADVSKAVKRILSGKLINSGQTCVAPDYILVQTQIKEAFLKELCRQLPVFYKGEALDSPSYPAMINQKHFNRVKSLVMDSISQGACSVFPLKFKEETRQMAPVVLTNVDWTMPVMQEEIFGPVLPVLEFAAWSQAVQLLQEKEKPLALYLFTRSRQAQRVFLRNLSFGGGCVNDTLLHLCSSRMGFGGVGNSGMGAYHGKEGFDAFTHKKSVLIKGAGPDIPLRYPPFTRPKEKLLHILMK